jgi:hypothetical protein
MAAIGKVSAVFTASTSGLTSGVKAASSSFRSLQSDTQGLASSMRALVAINGAQLFGSIASSAASGVRSLLAFAQGQAEVIDTASKMAARLGMTYGEFAGLSLAADLAGVSMESVGKASQKAEIAFANASAGSASATAAFSRLGLSMEQLNQMSPAERFDAIAEAIAALPTEAERAAAAVQVFGSSGADLLPLFAGGAEGIAQAREEAERLGLVLTTAQGQDVVAMNDAFTMVQKTIAGVVQQVQAYLSPAITAVLDTFTEFVGSVGGANIGQAIGDGILQGARFLAGVGDYIIQNFGSVFSFLSNVGAQWGVVVDAFNRTASFLSGVFSAAQALFLGIIGGFNAAVLGLASIAQQIGKFLRFDTSSIDEIVAGSEAFASNINAQIVESGAASAAAFQNAFAETTQPIGQAIAGPLTTALDGAIAQAEASASQIDEASRKPVEVQQTVVVDVAEALKGIDSRSSEGVAEMFRIMRGTGGDVQEQQLGVLERIADAVETQEADYPFAME